MAVLAEEIAEISGGFQKEIEEGAEHLMMNILQQHQYAYPFKSAIREIASNGFDSLVEKEVARAILLGEATIEDFFVERDGAIYKDSKFNSDYYDLNYLSAVNEVVVVYTDGGELGKDKVIIRDHGVGLGGRRLEKYFNLGFSTKRLMSKALGKFGIGAKAPLSIGVPFYTITSRYNGMEFRFNVYSYKVEPLIPKFDMEKMVENPTYQFTTKKNADGSPFIVHYKSTTEPNMVEIEISAKKHHKSMYTDAVKSQLLYFKNIRLFVGEAGKEIEQEVKANIMYEDDMIVLSTNSPYSKPHILLNNVNYGYINFEELELEQKLGNIGIKVDPEKVSINPSRESLIWDDKTREVVIAKFNEVVEIAQATINSELKETDFLKWLRICANASAANSLWASQDDDTVIGRLSRIVDMTKVELSYSPFPEYKYTSRLMDGIRIERIEMVTKREGSGIKKTVGYSQSWRAALTESLPILIAVGDISNRRNKYILNKMYKSGFVLIQLQLEGPSEQRIEEVITKKINREQAISRIEELTIFIQTSKDKVYYESIVVPDDFKANEDVEEIEIEVEEEKESAEERRKTSGNTILSTLRSIDYIRSNNFINGVKTPGLKVFEFSKVELPVHLIDSWENEEVFWSNSDTDSLLHTAGIITRYDEQVYCFEGINEEMFEAEKVKGMRNVTSYDFRRLNSFHPNSPVRLIRVSQNNTKYYKDFKHITKFFKEIKNKTITMSNALVRWNTARLMQEKFKDLNFMRGYQELNPERYMNYINIQKYIETNWKSFSINANTLGADLTTTGQLIAHLDKVGQFQLFVRQNPEDTEAISQLATELFNPQPGVEIQDGLAIDNVLYDTFNELLDWAQPVKTMCNMLQPLLNVEPLEFEQQKEIKDYFVYRQVSI